MCQTSDVIEFKVLRRNYRRPCCHEWKYDGWRCLPGPHGPCVLSLSHPFKSLYWLVKSPIHDDPKTIGIIKLFVLVILYIYPLKEIFQSDHQDSLLYTAFSHTNPYSISSSMHCGVTHQDSLPTCSLSPFTWADKRKDERGPRMLSLPPHLLSLPVRANRQAQGRAWPRAAFYRTHASTPHLAFEIPSAILA
jgi:hypothetical protein